MKITISVAKKVITKPTTKPNKKPLTSEQLNAREQAKADRWARRSKPYWNLVQ